MSGPFTEGTVPISERLTEYYRETMRIHTDDPVLNACVICRQSRCPDWRAARERLHWAGIATDRARTAGTPTPTLHAPQ